MTGSMYVKRLNKSGNYKSELDHDTIGKFKMVITPIENAEGQNEIRYMRTEKGILVSGEGYLVAGMDEKEIDAKCRRHTMERWKNLIQVEVKTENDLW